MTARRKKSKGQAIVLVTLALFAMFGLMGLAVDLGWMYFVQKSAQGAADAAALGAVQEAISRKGINNFGSFNCPAAGTNKDVFCTTGAQVVDCTTVSAPSNLYNGCLYAKNNGFDANSNARQKVTIAANCGYDITGALVIGCTAPTTASGAALGVKNVVYWVTVSTVQTVPQLFSGMVGNTTGTVTAIATAAVASAALPGSFWGLNQAGDCPAGAGTCGQDIATGGNTSITTPGAVVISSSCTGNGSGCGGQAGALGGAASVTGSSIVTQGGSSAVLSNGFTPMPPQAGGAKNFQDPTQGLPQPPLVAQSPIPSCGIPTGVVAGGTPGNPVLMGGLNYYSCTVNGQGKCVPDGGPIVITGNVQFRAGHTCGEAGGISDTSGTPAQTGTFQTSIFWGGMNITGTADFGAGQYVMAGQNPNALNNNNGGQIFSLNQATVTGDTSAGTLFIFTTPDGTGASYPGLSTQALFLNNLGLLPQPLYQGSIYLGKGNGTSIQLNGIDESKLPSAGGLNDVQYNGFLFWQDRRNSVDQYSLNPDDGTLLCNNGGAFPCVATTAEMGPNGQNCPSSDCSNSAVMSFGPGDIKTFNVKGIFYQPRGSYFLANHGNGNGCITSAIQFITGAYMTPGGNGNGICLDLTKPSLPFIKFVNALIQ